MPIGNNLPTSSEQSFLNRFEPRPQLIEPAVRACRLFNTALDTRAVPVLACPVVFALRHAQAQAVAPAEKPSRELLGCRTRGLNRVTGNFGFWC